MELSNKNLLLAGLLGSKISEKLDRFESLQNKMSEQALPPIPFLPLPSQIRVEASQKYLWDQDYRVFPTQIAESQQFFPVKFRKINDSQWYLLPYEPMVTISGKNNIVKREVAKKRTDKSFYGSIKEYWSQADYEITITGALYGAIETGTVQNCFPIEEFQTLKDFMLNPQGIEICCYPLNLLEVTKIVVQEFSFPFTKGENVQAYEIKAISDSCYELLIERNDV